MKIQMYHIIMIHRAKFNIKTYVSVFDFTFWDIPDRYWPLYSISLFTPELLAFIINTLLSSVSYMLHVNFSDL